MRPKWLKEEYNYEILLKNLDDEDDIFQTYVKTEIEAKEYCEREITAYGDVPEFQFYYRKVL